MLMKLLAAVYNMLTQSMQLAGMLMKLLAAAHKTSMCRDQCDRYVHAHEAVLSLHAHMTTTAVFSFHAHDAYVRRDE